MKGTYLGGLYEIDKNYDAVFFTEWDTRLAAALELVQEKNLVGTDRYQIGEMFVGFATAPQKSEGSEYDYYAPQDGKNYSVQADIYKFAFKATEELRDFGNTNQVMEYARLMAEIMDHTVKVNIYNLFNRAFDSNYPVAYDAVELCKTSHALANGSTGSNRLGTDADLGETTVESMIELMIATPNEDGAFIARVPKLLVTATNNWVKALQVTGSSQTTLQGVGESGRAVNAITRAWNIQPHFSPYLTDTDASFLIADKSPLALVWARRPELKSVYVDEKTDDWIWRLKAQFATVADTWRGIVGTSGI